MEKWKQAFKYRMYLMTLAKDILEMANEMKYTEQYLFEKEHATSGKE